MFYHLFWCFDICCPTSIGHICSIPVYCSQLCWTWIKIAIPHHNIRNHIPDLHILFTICFSILTFHWSNMLTCRLWFPFMLDMSYNCHTRCIQCWKILGIIFQTSIYNLPSILVLWHPLPHRHWSNILNSGVLFPFILDMAEYCHTTCV